MKKIKKIFLYLLGSFLAFTFNQISASATSQYKYGVAPMPVYPEYGIDFISKPTWWEKIFAVIFSPIFIIIIIIFAWAIGIIVFVKRQRKNVKKDT